MPARFQISDIIKWPQRKEFSGGYGLVQIDVRTGFTLYIIFDKNGFPVQDPSDLRRIEAQYHCKLKPIWISKQIHYGVVYKKAK